MPDKLEPEALLEEPGSDGALLEMATLKRWMLGDSRAGTEAMQSVRDDLTMCIGLVEISIGLHGIALVMCMVVMLRVLNFPKQSALCLLSCDKQYLMGHGRVPGYSSALRGPDNFE